MADMKTERIDCVGVICFRQNDVLLIRRGTAPRIGEWSMPGGRIEPGESEAEAALRELKEETGVNASLVLKVATIDTDFEGRAYRLHDYAAIWTDGDPVGADDAMEARFIPVDQIHTLGMWQKTVEIIHQAHTEIGARPTDKGALA